MVIKSLRKQLKQARTVHTASGAHAPSQHAGAMGDGAGDAGERKPWRRILWEPNHGYEDNYVDETFLSSMVSNAHVRRYDYLTVVKQSVAIVWQLSCVAVFGVVFRYTHTRSIDAPLLTALNVLLMALGYGVRAATDPLLPGKLVDNARIGLVLFGSLMGVSPIMLTLSKTFSNDTIYALAILCAAFHVLFFDYSSPTHTASHNVSGSLSLNAAIFAAVLLASRLDSVASAFAVVLFAVELFALLPILLHYLKRHSDRLYLYLSVGMVVLTALLLFTTLTVVTISYVAATIFVSFIAPLWLIHNQRYKNEIAGPWDLGGTPASARRAK